MFLEQELRSSEMQHFGGFQGAGLWPEATALGVDAGVPAPHAAGRVLRMMRGHHLWLFQSSLNAS